MSCYDNNCYLPNPTRAWSRVQNNCSLITSTQPQFNNISNEMINKGNILQYKSNSSNITKNQKYSKIAKKQWVNRNTSWALQSTNGRPTNPNLNSLKRGGNVTNIAIDPITGAILGPTSLPVTCQNGDTPSNYDSLPDNVSSSGSEPPQVPPIVSPTSDDIFPEITNDTPIIPIVIQDGGSLICTIKENICTGETNIMSSTQFCHPSSDSDVPGNEFLCWKDGTNTWFPWQRYVMSNSSTKWPTNSILSSAVQPSPPIIIDAILNGNVVTLTWDYNENCLPANSFSIFQNGIFVKSVSKNVFKTDISIDASEIYNFYIIAVTNGSNISSEPSNVITVNVET